jgi:hypothetical protein
MTADLISTQITASAVIVWVMQKLKNSNRFPWLSQYTWLANRTVSIIVSGAMALGIHADFDPVKGVLAISGLTYISLMHGLGDWLRSAVIQQLIYIGAVKRTEEMEGLLK